jgi:hypothetical protein
MSIIEQQWLDLHPDAFVRVRKRDGAHPYAPGIYMRSYPHRPYKILAEWTRLQHAWPSQPGD